MGVVFFILIVSMFTYVCKFKDGIDKKSIECSVSFFIVLVFILNFRSILTVLVKSIK